MCQGGYLGCQAKYLMCQLRYFVCLARDIVCQAAKLVRQLRYFVCQTRYLICQLQIFRVSDEQNGLSASRFWVRIRVRAIPDRPSFSSANPPRSPGLSYAGSNSIPEGSPSDLEAKLAAGQDSGGKWSG